MGNEQTLKKARNNTSIALTELNNRIKGTKTMNKFKQIIRLC